MDWAFWFALLIMLVGLAGTVLPMLPGIPIIFLAILGYAWFTHFTVFGFWFILIMGLLTTLSLVIDYFAGVYGARRYGATKFGAWGSIIGGIIGFFIVPPFGIFLGPLIGAISGEIIAGKSYDKALEVGWGTFLGSVSGSLAKIVIGLSMVLWFIAKAV